jgi:hypothetical protein
MAAQADFSDAPAIIQTDRRTTEEIDAVLAIVEFKFATRCCFGLHHTIQS